MSTDYAANAPEFWFHHGFLDKIWYMWQRKSNDHKYVHFLQRNVTKMLGCQYTRRDYIDSHHLPRCIRVKYSTFPKGLRKEVHRNNNKNASKLVGIQNSFNRKEKQDIIRNSKTSMKYGIDSSKYEILDDMGRTSHTFWDPYLIKRWDKDFPSCKASRKDKYRAHKLHFMIDV